MSFAPVYGGVHQFVNVRLQQIDDRHRGAHSCDFIVVALLALGLSGCLSQTVTMYPIQGPLATQQPLPVVTARADGITGNTGDSPSAAIWRRLPWEVVVCRAPTSVGHQREPF